MSIDPVLTVSSLLNTRYILTYYVIPFIFVLAQSHDGPRETEPGFSGPMGKPSKGVVWKEHRTYTHARTCVYASVYVLHMRDSRSAIPTTHVHRWLKGVREYIAAKMFIRQSVLGLARTLPRRADRAKGIMADGRPIGEVSGE